MCLLRLDEMPCVVRPDLNCFPFYLPIRMVFSKFLFMEKSMKLEKEHRSQQVLFKSNTYVYNLLSSLSNSLF